MEEEDRQAMTGEVAMENVVRVKAREDLTQDSRGMASTDDWVEDTGNRPTIKQSRFNKVFFF